MNFRLSRFFPSGSGGSSSPAGKSMKIGTKIFALVGFCLALLGLVAGTSVWQMHKIGIEIEGIAERDLPLTKGLIQITIHQLEQAINFERAIRTGEEMEKHTAARKQFEKAVKTFKGLTVKIDKEFKETGLIAKYARDTAVTKEGRHESVILIMSIFRIPLSEKV